MIGGSVIEEKRILDTPKISRSFFPINIHSISRGRTGRHAVQTIDNVTTYFIGN